jgi:RNA polymerase sigma factor for flagellar operon FliA
MYNAAGQFSKDQLVRRFAPLVKRTAHHLMARLPSSVQIDDLVQNGMIGLLDAIDRFEAGMGAQFETYATQRIRGAILDGLRENDWLPRSLRREVRRVERAINRLEQELGRPPSEDELAGAMGVPLAEYQKMLLDMRGHQIVSFEDLTEEGGEDFLERHFVDDANDPSRILEDRNMRKRLVQGIERLPEREKLMMALYYEQELNLREIGEIMGVTESRVSQLHSQAVARLRVRLFGRSGAGGKAGAHG